MRPRGTGAIVVRSRPLTVRQAHVFCCAVRGGATSLAPLGAEMSQRALPVLGGTILALSFAVSFVPSAPAQDAPARLLGRCLAESGQPAAGLKVNLLREGVPSGVTTTGQDGAFEFASLAPGVYGVAIAIPQPADAPAGCRLVSMPGDEISEGLPVRAGSSFDVGSIRLRRVGASVRVRVRRDSGAGVPSRVYGWMPGKEGPRAPFADCDAEGGATLDLPDAHADTPVAIIAEYVADGVTLTASPAPVRIQPWQTAKVELSIPHRRVDTVLRLAEANGSPLAGARVLVTPEGSDWPWSAYAMGRTDPEGRIRLARATPGAWRVGVAKPDGAWRTVTVPVDAAGEQGAASVPAGVTVEFHLAFRIGGVPLRELAARLGAKVGQPPQFAFFLVPSGRLAPEWMAPIRVVPGDQLDRPVLVPDVVPGAYWVVLCPAFQTEDTLVGADLPAGIDCAKPMGTSRAAHGVILNAGGAPPVASGLLQVEPGSGAHRVVLTDDVKIPAAIDLARRFPPFAGVSEEAVRTLLVEIMR